MKSSSVVLAVFLVVVATVMAAYAASMPTGPYSSWSQAQQQQAAAALKEICGAQCESYAQRAKEGEMRATYEAAACTAACYVNNLPDDYPQLDSLKQQARDNYNEAKKLGSTAPVFLK